MDDRPPVRVLLIDDDPKFRSFVSAGLRESGFDCVTAAEPSAALVTLLDASPEARPDIVLLDVMMPGLSGWDFLARLRASGVDTPVLFVTALEAVDDRVRGLRLGADDYIIKPFAFAELLARVHAVVNRHRTGTTLRCGDLEMDLVRRLVSIGDAVVELSPKEFDLLRVLVQRRRQVVSRELLLRDVWRFDSDPGTNVVDVHVGRLRRRLGPWATLRLETVRGRGYRLTEPSAADSAAEDSATSRP